MKLITICLYFLFCKVSCNEDKEIEEEENRNRILEQLTKTRTVILDDYHLVTRHVATDVFQYRNYRTVSVIYYPVIRDVSEARFTFQAEELHMNNIGSCDAQDVIINIKHGSYPAVNPDGYEFPSHYINPASREKIHTIELTSDGTNYTYVIENPKPGNWYALLYKRWEDPRTQKVEQQGLVADCHTILYSDLQVKIEEKIEIIDCYSDITVDYANLPVYYKCTSTDSAEQINLNIAIINTTVDSKNVLFKLHPSSLPTEETFIISCALDPKSKDIQSISFSPNPATWHYITINHIEGNSSRYRHCESYIQYDFDEPDNITVLDLMRDDKGRFFTFDYGLPSTDLQDATSLVNLTSNEVKSLRFNVHPTLDIGGSLVIESSLLMSLKYYAGYRRSIENGLLAFTEENQFFKLVVCMNIGYPSIPQKNGHCKYNDQIKQALFVLNSTDSESIYDKVIIPYPESGTWYLTFKLFCDDVVCPCSTSDNGTTYYVDPNAIEKGEELNVSSKDTRLGQTQCNTTIVLSISSRSCFQGKCSNHGNCLLNTAGGLVMSFCSCTAGYGAWDCSDNSRMDSRAHMLVSVLLLTLSNLLFFASIYVAIIRLYYNEAMMYAFTMVFSTFYHACDAPAQVAYCIMKRNILQFGDFYCGIMCFWVTLLAMCIIRNKMRSSLQLIGAIVIALLTTWNMHSFVSFMLPVTVGIFILMLSWVLDYRKIRTMRYPKSYYFRYFPLGISLVAVGLICYAFLQTEQNYKIVHSMWHMVIAASVVFLLPDVKRGSNTSPFLPTHSFLKFLNKRPVHIAGD